MNNEMWAQEIIGQLVAQGIEHFCVCPGSRSTPLVVALSHERRAHSMVHYDERGAAFHALGIAKGSGRPAAVIATSGTAVGNLLPAVMEASLDGVPLILLTGDRPPELRDAGANQTCDQVKIFGRYVRWECDLPCPSDRLKKEWVGSTVAQGVLKSRYPYPGPVHFNVMVREPFFSDERGEIGKSVAVSYGEPLGPEIEIPDVEKGIILAGDGAEGVFEIAERLQWPIFADILSPARTDHPLVVNHYDHILEDCKPEAILYFGRRMVSKRVAKLSAEWVCHVSRYPEREDPHHRLTHRVIGKPRFRCAQRERSAWTNQWIEAGWSLSLGQRVDEAPFPNEPAVARLVGGKNVFFGNGMPIRDADQFLFIPGRYFGNRGMSGIDGNIATAAGIAVGLGEEVVAVIGDQAFLHDLNSLPLIKKGVTLVVVNNGGSGIFSFLPISEKKEIFETYFAASHKMTFRAAASLFDIPYFTPKSGEEFQQALSNGPALIEVATDRTANFQFHQELSCTLQRN